MTTQLPHGLIQVVSATRTELPSDPVDVIYERKKALHNFWKVHNAQSRVSRDPVDIRCRQLFWRVWSNPRLSLSLSQDIILQLWMRCQRTYDLSPFDLQITYPDRVAQQLQDGFADRIERRLSVDSESSNYTDPISPSQPPSTINATTVDNDGRDDTKSDRCRQETKAANKSAENQPYGLNRTSSGSDTPRKRSAGSNVTAKTRNRPSINRKRTSETMQRSDTIKPRRSIMKSPRTSFEDKPSTRLIQPPQLNLTQRILTSPTDGAAYGGRKISDFALTSASSWQSVESQGPRDSTNTEAGPSVNALQIDGNFRERFVETQKVLRSSTNLEALSRSMRKTGSVVRFADDVDGPADIRRQKAANKEKNSEPNFGGISGLRTVSEGQSSNVPTQGQIESWRPSGLQRHDSIGSVAAVSEDSEASDEESMMMLLPRTKSQLSLGIANLKRSQSQGEQTLAIDDKVAVTSPDIEQEQDDLISGRAGKKPSAEEEKLLAMGRKDGVTRAGGVNLPKELTVKGPRSPKNAFEEPEQLLF